MMLCIFSLAGHKHRVGGNAEQHPAIEFCASSERQQLNHVPRDKR